MKISVENDNPGKRTEREEKEARELARELIGKVIKERELTMRELKTLGLMFSIEVGNWVERQMSVEKAR